MNKKIAILVSGGVDSSVSLALLKEQGYQLTAFYLKIWLEDELSYLGNCPWQEDLTYAQAVCDQFGVPLHVVSMQKEYHQKVVSYLLDEIKKGRTPNPDVLCNQQIKFGAFFDHINQHYAHEKFDYVATGHYAQIEHGQCVSVLKKGVDPIKDQTYFLAYLNQNQLQKALFPIGSLPKSEVRALALRYNLLNAERKDSQGICFLGKFNFADFLRAHIPNRMGNIVEFETHTILGMHEGFWFYTIGQRHGLKLAGGPWYVVSKDVEENVIYVSNQYKDITWAKNGMIVSDVHWNQGHKPLKIDLDVRFRHGPTVHPCLVYYLPDENLKIVLKEPSQQGIAQGQFAVLYDGEVCLGGGFIQKAF